jgi:hypothetical protein
MILTVLRSTRENDNGPSTDRVVLIRPCLSLGNTAVDSYIQCSGCSGCSAFTHGQVVHPFSPASTSDNKYYPTNHLYGYKASSTPRMTSSFLALWGHLVGSQNLQSPD